MYGEKAQLQNSNPEEKNLNYFFFKKNQCFSLYTVWDVTNL